ncbi:unnamed protein product, partial [Staurois parvus]
MVRVTSQGSEQVASSVVQRVRQRDGEVSSGSETGCRTDTGPRPRQSLWVWP